MLSATNYYAQNYAGIIGKALPIAYASRTLTPAETNYAQLEKEGLALIFQLKKFHKLAIARLQWWAIFLMGYLYDLEFRPMGQHCNTDRFSCLPRVRCWWGGVNGFWVW